MISTVIHYFSLYVLCGIGMLILDFLTDLVVAVFRGVDQVHPSRRVQPDESVSKGWATALLIAIWPILLIMWLWALIHGMTLQEYTVVAKAAYAERKQLEAHRLKQRVVNADKLWTPTRSGHQIFSRLFARPEGKPVGIQSHMVMACTTGFIVLRIMPEEFDRAINYGFETTLEAAQKDCEDDTDWQVLCQPERFLEREDAWQEANRRMNTGTAPA